MQITGLADAFRVIGANDRNLWTGALTAGLLASFLLPARHAESLPSACVYYRLTGRRCPGCGMSRAFVLLSHGHIGRAWRINRLSLIAYPLVVYLVVSGWLSLLRSRVSLQS